jgi:hypothetical protein
MKRQLILDLLEITASKQSIAKYISDIKRSALEYVGTSNQYKIDKTNEIVDDMFDFDTKIKPEIISLYTEFYTEEELDTFLSWYKSDVGKSILTKTPIITEKIGKSIVDLVVPLLIKLDEMDEIEEE